MNQGRGMGCADTVLMSQVEITKNRSQIAGMAVKMHAGLVLLGTDLGITQVTATGFKSQLDVFLEDLGGYNSKRSSRQAAFDLFHDKETVMSDWIMKVRNSLISPFGDKWNTMWAQVGFVQPKIGLPRRLQDRITLAKKVSDFLATNPSYEVASQGITAAQGVLVRQAVIDAQTPVQQANMDLKTALTTLNTSQAALVKSMRYVIKILSGGLAKNDPAWEVFGLNMPATKTTPGAPTGLQATLMGTQVLLQCDVTPLAERYRFRTKIVGVETDYKLAASSKEPSATLKDIMPGVTLQVIAQAVNGGSQGVACDPITVTVPLSAPAVTKPAISESELAPLNAIQPNGNSNGNGNGNGSHAVSRLS